MSEKTRDVFTVPNALTAARLVLSPLIAKRLHDNPKRWWLPAAAFMMSDMVDGYLARLGDKSEKMNRLGFRRSEFGRQLDPVTDKLVGSQMLIAGIRNETIPKPLGAAALAQKAAVSAYTLYQTSQGLEVHVNWLGRRSEFATNLGMGLLFPIGEIEHGDTQQRLRAASMALGGAGLVGAVLSNRLLAQETAEQTWTPVQ